MKYQHMPRYMVGGLVFLSGLNSCIQFDAELPKVCFLQENVAISLVDSLPPNLNREDAQEVADGAALLFPDGVPVTVQETFVRDNLESIPEVFDSADTDARLYLTEVMVVAQAGLPDFSIINRVSLTARSVSAASSLPELVLAVCDSQAGCDTSQSYVSLAGNASQDIINYLREGTLEFELKFEGALPLQAWAFDTDVCFRAEAEYDVGI